MAERLATGTSYRGDPAYLDLKAYLLTLRWAFYVYTRRGRAATCLTSILPECVTQCGGRYGSFVMRASSYLKKLYNLYNHRFFGDRLPEGVKIYYAPKLDKVNTKDGKHRSTCAVTYFYEDSPPKIIIRKTATSNMRHMASDLIHEMVHVAKPNADCEAESRNSEFQKEMKRLAKAGAFQNVW